MIGKRLFKCDDDHKSNDCKDGQTFSHGSSKNENASLKQRSTYSKKDESSNIVLPKI